MEVRFEEFLISDDKTLLDEQVIFDFLTNSYWATGRTVETIRKSIEGSVCYGVYDGTKQIGFARAITDGATFYYIADVFVLDAYRGRGIGKKLMESILNERIYDGLTGVLATQDAHGLYEQYGFVRDAERFMRRKLPQT
jgi:GNAT superfamily N-acetyltransferase